jgi:hypothetical protein
MFIVLLKKFQNLLYLFSDQGRILDRVWQVFGGLEAETIPLIEEKLLTSEKVQVDKLSSKLWGCWFRISFKLLMYDPFHGPFIWNTTVIKIAIKSMY